jgi:hypothetical protein
VEIARSRVARLGKVHEGGDCVKVSGPSRG